jgi:hypothetical protein
MERGQNIRRGARATLTVALWGSCRCVSDVVSGTAECSLSLGGECTQYRDASTQLSRERYEMMNHALHALLYPLTK